MLLDPKIQHICCNCQQSRIHSILLVQGRLCRVLDFLLLEVGDSGPETEVAEESPELDLEEVGLGFQLLDYEPLLVFFEFVVREGEQKDFLDKVDVFFMVSDVGEFQEYSRQVFELLVVELELVLQAVGLNALADSWFYLLVPLADFSQKLVDVLRLDSLLELDLHLLIRHILINTVQQSLSYQMQPSLLPSICFPAISIFRQLLELGRLNRLHLPHFNLLDPGVHVIFHVPQVVDLVDRVLLQKIVELHSQFVGDGVDLSVQALNRGVKHFRRIRHLIYRREVGSLDLLLLCCQLGPCLKQFLPFVVRNIQVQLADLVQNNLLVQVLSRLYGNILGFLHLFQVDLEVLLDLLKSLILTINLIQHLLTKIFQMHQINSHLLFIIPNLVRPFRMTLAQLRSSDPEDWEVGVDQPEFLRDSKEGFLVRIFSLESLLEAFDENVDHFEPVNVYGEGLAELGDV